MLEGCPPGSTRVNFIVVSSLVKRHQSLLQSCFHPDAEMHKEMRASSNLPLSQRSSVHHDDGILDESLGTDQLVVAGIVHYVDDPELAADGLAAPGEVTVVETESAVLLVTAADAEGVDPLGGELGHGGRPGQLELPLLPDGAALAAGGAALVPVIPGDTHPAPLTSVSAIIPHIR